MAENKKPQLVKGVTPKGVAAWPYLNTPDEYKGKKSYKTNLTLTAEDAGALVQKIELETHKVLLETKEKLEETIANGKTGDAKAKAKKALAGLTTSLPFTAAVDDDGNETGDVVFKFKANAEFEDKKTGQTKAIVIPIFDAKGQPTKASIWGGSVIRVSYALVPYYVASANTCGVSLRIEGIKVIELNSGGGAGRSADALGFGEEEDGYEATSLTGDESGDDETDDSPDF